MERKVPIPATRWQQMTAPDSCVAPRRGRRETGSRDVSLYPGVVKETRKPLLSIGAGREVGANTQLLLQHGRP